MFKFIDLFCGIGGFHIALKNLGGKCVFSSDIDKECQKIYNDNFNIMPKGDITKINVKEIPKFDLLCGGFPCQPFSVGGNKKGFEDERGNLFFNIEKILKFHKPKYLMLENVKHLTRHNKGKTWKIITKRIKDLGYILPDKEIILSPHHLGIPQNRERVFILGIHKKFVKKNFKNNMELPLKKNFLKTNIFDFVDKKLKDKSLKISNKELKILKCWDEFKINIKNKIIGFPIWINEFNKNYNISEFPEWKQTYIKKNRKLYLENKKFINKWMKKYNVENFSIRDKKFEWQAGKNYNSIFDVILQYRQSGIRCKKPDFFPTLVAMVQIPIIPKLKRKLSLKEVSKLQSFPDTFKLNKNIQQGYKQFGNSVNVEVIKFLAKQLLKN